MVDARDFFSLGALRLVAVGCRTGLEAEISFVAQANISQPGVGFVEAAVVSGGWWFEDVFFSRPKGLVCLGGVFH